MRKILFPENSGDVRVIADALHSGGQPGKAPLAAVVIRPLAAGTGDRRFEVDDLRGAEARVETFRTVDGALGFATGLMEPRLCHAIMDVSGTYATYAELACRPNRAEPASPGKTRLEPIAKWNPEKDGHESLVRLFVDSVSENVHNVHEIGCSRIPGEPETFLVEVVFRNDADERQEVDASLQAMNGLDWRVACDKLLCRFARRLSRDPDSYDWPTPDARVEYAYDPDDGDVICVVKLSWHVDRRTYDMAYDYVTRERNG